MVNKWRAQLFKMSATYQDDLNLLLEHMQNVHFPTSKNYQGSKRIQADLCSENCETEKIFHLVESHTPGLRTLATFQYDKAIAKGSDHLPLSKHLLTFQCEYDTKKSIDNMLKMVAEMPKEWTLVQLTPAFNPAEHLQVDCDTKFTNPIHISVFNCGQSKEEPVCVTINPPTCPVTGDTVELNKEMANIVNEYSTLVTNVVKKVGTRFKAYQDKLTYEEEKEMFSERLKYLLKQLQNDWLRVWRCLFVGKYTNSALEDDLKLKLEDFCKNNIPFEVPNRAKVLLLQLVKGSPYLTPNEMCSGLQYIFPEETRDLIKSVLIGFNKLTKSLSLSNKLQRHPVILIIDEQLDQFPWELIDVLQEHPVSRMPSFHFTYALFKEHEPTIVNGLKANINPHNGAYIINPNNDLKQMELRLKSFFKYYFPKWKGVIGREPTCKEFSEYLTQCDVFSYNGHGSGSQYLPENQIRKLRVNAVVFLFGCSSVKLSSLGPDVECVGPHYVYLLACSPLVMGMLWTVTDLDTDRLTCGLLSQWIETSGEINWKNIDKVKWEALGYIESVANPLPSEEKRETEFLRVLCKARKLAKHYMNQAAFVARGLPVKIK